MAPSVYPTPRRAAEQDFLPSIAHEARTISDSIIVG